MYQIPLLQTLESSATRSQAWINGFPADWLLSVRANADRRAAGLETSMLGYAAIHPYFLRPGANELRVEYAATSEGSSLALRVAALEVEPGKDLGTVFPEHELLRLVAPAAGAGQPRGLAGEFQWAGVPPWAWTRAPAIADTADNRHGLQAAVQRFWDALNALAGPSGAASSKQLERDSRASMREFIQASELRGRPFTLLDDLLAISSTLALAGDASPESFLKDREDRYQATRGQPSSDDEASRHPPVGRLANGALPPRLTLRPLDSFDGLTMMLFAEGRLARLTDSGGRPVIQFVSNYSDGNRGAPKPVRFVCDPWFRKNAQQQWELDALYPSQSARQVLANPWPQQVLEQLPY